MICRAKQQAKIESHRTRDEVSEGGARALEVARIPPGHGVSCRCSEGECTQDKCDQLYVHDESGARVATFHGFGMGAKQMADGGICVYRLPQTSTHDRAPLAELNRKHETFWRPIS